MIRFSQRGWNNVIIVSMLLLIVLFNSSSNFLNNNQLDPEQPIPLLPPNTVVMTFDFGLQKVERIGRGWRVLSAKEERVVNQGSLSNMVSNWLQAEIEPIDERRGQDGLVVVVWLAGQDQARIYQFYQQGQTLLVEVEQRSYQITNMTLKQLILPGVL